MRRVVVFNGEACVEGGGTCNIFVGGCTLLQCYLIFLTVILPCFSTTAVGKPREILTREIPSVRRCLPIVIFSRVSPSVGGRAVGTRAIVTQSGVRE